MMKKNKIFILVIMLSGVPLKGFCQSKVSSSAKQQYAIQATIKRFLKWDKKGEDESNVTGKAEEIAPPLTKGGYPDTTTQLRIDTAGLTAYKNYLRKSGLFSETFLDYVHDYYSAIDKQLEKRPKMNALVKVNGMDIDIFLNTYDTADILDNIDKGHIDRCYVVYNKAIARFTISKIIRMVFTLTKTGNKWLIDYIGYDNTSRYSL